MTCSNCGPGQECEPNYVPVAPGGNGPTLDDEQALLEAEFGPANADGIYGAVVEE